MAINPRMGEEEDRNLLKFLPVQLGHFLTKQNGGTDRSAPLQKKKIENPYANLVKQFETILDAFTA